MAPNLSGKEQDQAMEWRRKGCTPIDIHRKLVRARGGKGLEAPCLTAVRKFLKGKTHRRGSMETRGRKCTYSMANIRRMNKVRKELVKKTKGLKYISWDTIVKKSGVPAGDRTTAAKAFKREGFPVEFRTNREKPQRTKEHEEERESICGVLRKRPTEYWSDDVDLIIDNKLFDAPTTAKAREYLEKRRVHGQLRLASEGLQKEYTKPNAKRHKINAGGTVKILAGISGDRVVLWEDIGPHWNGAKAAEMYRGPILETLRRTRGLKPSYLIAEDNDPTGYKSGAGVKAKRELKIKTVRWPRYSPDLNPLDFSLWDNIQERMFKRAPHGSETVAAFTKRLRLTALRTPRTAVRKMIENIRVKAQQIYEAKGGNISSD